MGCAVLAVLGDVKTPGVFLQVIDRRGDGRGKLQEQDSEDDREDEEQERNVRYGDPEALKRIEVYLFAPEGDGDGLIKDAREIGDHEQSRQHDQGGYDDVFYIDPASHQIQLQLKVQF